jgi:vancomycin resistance protein YoaR
MRYVSGGLQEVLVSVEQTQSFGSTNSQATEHGVVAHSLSGASDWPAESLGPEQEYTSPPESYNKAPRRRMRRFLTFLTAILLLVVLGLSGLLYGFDRAYAGKIFPNIAIRGVAVGEMTPEQARQALESRFAPFLAQPVTLAYEGRTWTPTLAEIGVQLEIDQAISTAYASGRENGMADNLREVAAVWQNGLEIPLRLTIDQDAMQRYLVETVGQIDQAPVDAQLTLDGTLIDLQPSANGQQLLISETLQEITASLQELAPQTLVLRTRELQPQLRDAAVYEARTAIADLLAGPITLAVGEETLVWSLEDLARLIRVERIGSAGDDRLAVSVDQEAIRAQLNVIADESEVAGENPRLDWNGGDLQIIRDGTPGSRIDIEQATRLTLNALNAPADQRTIIMPFREIPPPITATNLDQLGITDLLSVGQSDFSGSAAYRITNINAGMKLLHGVLIAPGEEFSFNNTIGRIDGSNGFVEGYAIIQNRTQLEWGGGICQDSTTVFRAAFWAGLPITERWGHSFYISWYDRYGYGDYGNGPGMDATIFTGGPDLRFLNDTENWLLMQTYVDNSRALAEVRIYGTDTGRDVKLEGPFISNRTPAPSEPVYVAEPSRPPGQPRQSDTARGGMEIRFTRIVLQDGQEIERREFLTKFRPWPNIFEINPADLGPDGKPLPTPTVEPTVDPAAPAPVPPEVPPEEDGGGNVEIQPAPPQTLPTPVND